MNSFGKNFRVEIFGESHGALIGATIDGVIPGIPLSEEDFKEDILRRKSGGKWTTPRVEEDRPEIVSGVYNGHTTGAPLTILFRNADTRSEDYSGFVENPRPGHADYTARIKSGGFNDPRGGGHFSGRLTLPIVAAGVLAKKMLYFADIKASLSEIGGEADSSKWPALLEQAAAEGDSLGGVVICVAEGLPIGIGEPFWDSVESCVAHAVFSIPGVRGIEFGDGFAAAAMKGSEHNDPYPEHHCHHDDPDHECCHGEGEHHCHHDDPDHECCHGEGEGEHHCHHEGGGCCGRHRKPLIPLTNHAGGVNGGISNGNPLLFRVAFKPTASIAKGGVPGRHDVCFALRTPVIVEAMCAIALASLIV